MYKGKKILGMTVFDLPGGKNLGRVKDIVFDPKSEKALALIIPGRSIFHVLQWLEFENIQRKGKDFFMARPGTKILNIREVQGAKELLKLSFKNLMGLDVVTNTGKLIGNLEDIYLGIPGGQLKGIEVSLGFMDDFLSGREFVPQGSIENFGEDCVVIAEEKNNQRR